MCLGSNLSGVAFRLKEFEELPPEEKEKFSGVPEYVV